VVPGLLDWWYRMRRVVGPPGPLASRAAVPTDLEAARRAELAALFEHCDALEVELFARERACERQVDEIGAEAADAVERLLADARERAPTAHAEAGAVRRSGFDDAAREVQRRARADARAVTERASASAPAIAAAAVDLVRRFAADTGTTAGRPESR
jgi:hypothetical protein